MSQSAAQGAAQAAPGEHVLPAGAARAASRGRLRLALSLGGVAVALAVAGGIWLATPTGFSTDDAYIRAPKLAVATDIGGTVARVLVHEGEAVRAGTPLVELDALPYRIAADEARAALDAARIEAAALQRDYARAQGDVAASEARAARAAADASRFSSLVGSGGVTRAEYDSSRFDRSESEAALDAKRAGAAMLLARLGGKADTPIDSLPSVRLAASRLAEAQRQLDHTVLRAPFDGVITNAESVQPGQYLAASTPALALVGSHRVWVEAFPKETDLEDSREGDRAQIRVDSYPGLRLSGRIESIAPAAASAFSVLPAQNASGNWVKIVQRIPVRIAIDTDDATPSLRDGMSVTVIAQAQRRKTLADLLP